MVPWLKETLFDCNLANTKGFLFMPMVNLQGACGCRPKNPPSQKK